MCGILGISSTKKELDFSRFKKNIALLNHRGPDHSDYWVDDKSKNFMGFTRLSIIDLSESGNQPMISSCKKYSIVFNGEIYNHQKLKEELIQLGYEFKSTSDTEVLLNAYIEWGEDFLIKIQGMFGLGIYDQVKNQLILARDIAGEKPLFYYANGHSISYASELKAIVESIPDCKKLDINSFNHYLGNGYIQRDQTIFCGIKKLTAGEFLVFNSETGEIKRKDFWKLKSLVPKKNSSPKHLMLSNLESKLEDLLESSVKQQLISDVPLGMMLSGGVDSSLMVAIASRFKSNLDTYTVIFPDSKAYNEQNHSRLISKNFQTNHNELDAGSIEPELIEKLSYFFDEPMTDSSILPTYLLCKEMSKFCKVAIGGDGADELFGGYNHHVKLSSLHNFAKFVPYSLRNILSKNLITFLPENTRGIKTIELFGKDLNNLEFSSSLMFDYSERQKLIINTDLVKKINYKKNLENITSFDFITKITRDDFQNYLSEDILVKIDRSSMANSLEVRSPFLDKSIIEFAYQEVPSNYKVRGKNKKILLKSLARKLLPTAFDIKRKQGFSIPINEFLKSGKWYDFFAEKIFSFDGIEINKEFALKMLNDQKQGGYNGEKLFSLVQFICWYQRHIQIDDTIKMHEK